MKPASAPSALKVQAVLGDDYKVLEFDAGTPSGGMHGRSMVGSGWSNMVRRGRRPQRRATADAVQSQGASLGGMRGGGSGENTML
jgi:hypothetical protein